MHKLITSMLILVLSFGLSANEQKSINFLNTNISPLSTSSQINFNEEEEEEEDFEEDDFEDEDEMEEVSKKELMRFKDSAFPYLNHEPFKSTLKDSMTRIDIYDYIEETYYDYHDMLEDEPQLAKQFLAFNALEMQCELCGHIIQESRNKEIKEKLSAQLKELLPKLFELKMTLYKAEIQELEQELKEMQQLYKKRQDMKDKILEIKFLRLTTDEDLLD